MKKSFRHRFGIQLLVLVMLAGMLAACTSGAGPSDDEPNLLRIGVVYGGDSRNEAYMRQQYTEIYEFTQGVEVELVYAVDQTRMYYGFDTDEEQPDPFEEMMALMEGPNPPDVVILDYTILKQLIEEHMLLDLETYMANDNFDLSPFAPIVIEGLRAAGGDRLYALAPEFSSSALVFNRGLFNEAGVEVPEEGMTWDQVFELARRVSSGEGQDKVFGFSFNQYAYDELFFNLEYYTSPLQLQIVDQEGENMMVDSERWAEVLNTFVSLYEEGVIPSRTAVDQLIDYSHPYSYDLFLSGKLAMTLMHYSGLDQLINANNQAEVRDDFDRIDWDVVTFPVHAEAPEIGGAVAMSPIVAINARAENPDGAWDFIKFINGEKWAQLKSKSSYQLVSRVEYNEPKGGLDYNLDAFFALKPPENDMYYLYTLVPNYWELIQIGQSKFNTVLEGDLSVEEALAQWQTEGNVFLQRSGQDDASGVETFPFVNEVEETETIIVE